MKVSIIDYGLSNLHSVCAALRHLGAEPELVNTPQEILDATALILPGVGAFRDGMAGLERHGLVEPIRRKVSEGTPLLGICLGMQLLFTESEEFGLYPGLDLIPGRVVRIPGTDTEGSPLKVPHISWAPLLPTEGRMDFSGTALATVQPGQECYFIHSYHAQPEDPSHLLAVTQYGGQTLTAAVTKGSVVGCQFHPERSGKVGLAILEEFLRLTSR